MTISNHIEYGLLGVSLVLLQFAGYSALTLPFLALTAVLMFSFKSLQTQAEESAPFSLFLVTAFIVGLVHLIFRDTTAKSLMMWGQLYFLAIILACASNKQKVISIIKYVIYAIFLADITSNILLAAGYSLPWTHFPPIRPGEILPRFPGVKSSSLFSGSISFLALCCIIQEPIKPKWLKFFIEFMMCINLLLAGSFRYYIILAAVIGLYVLKLYRKPKLLISFYICFIVFVVLFTYLTKDISQSNMLRWKLWLHTIDHISDSPIWGIGFYFQNLREHTIFTFHNLAVAGVTESTILLFAWCFGIPIMVIFLYALYKTLRQFSNYSEYKLFLGLFLGLSLDLFWGGSLDNCMSLSIFLLCMYQINHDEKVQHHHTHL